MIKILRHIIWSSEDLESGVGKWLYTYVNNEIKD